MTTNKPAMKMPELLVFARMFVVGFFGAEIFRATFYLGTNFSNELDEVALGARVLAIMVGLALCLVYAINREAHVVAARMGRSLRIDLLILAVIGAYSNELVAPWLSKVHGALKAADPNWAPVILGFLCVVLLSPLTHKFWPRQPRPASQLYFIADEEVRDEQDDVLASAAQAKSFAEAVLASGAHPGLIFGVDGPWGVGKTSFINLAQRYWKQAADKVIVCRFEPLRYASEPDLAERLIRDVSAAIQNEVFAPEFKPAASRYSKLIKGKADVSFFGFKISLEPSSETIDELLDDLDEALRRIGRRIIIVIDDLDRLDAKTTNSVLFATRRALRLSQATYVLCYDTELLAGGKDEGSRAREFLEKFVTVKLSLFIDSSSLRDFLRRDWERAESRVSSVPSDTMIKLGAIINELAEILSGDLAASYLPLVGDLRKVKRFINAILLVQLEKTNLGQTDFNRRDLINLMLLHLNYPGLFRRIYAEETEGRNGVFSLRRDPTVKEYKNSEAFLELVAQHQGPSGLLLTQLFDVRALGLADGVDLEEAFLRSRACFNSARTRNLESYLKLIVRFVTPEPQETFVLYANAVDRFQKGASISSILTSPEFTLELGENAHDQFWRVLVNQSHNFNNVLAAAAIETLVDYLPRYAAFAKEDHGLRQRSIYSLIRLLDRAGWGVTPMQRYDNSAKNVREIAWRIFGEDAYRDNGLLQRLVSPDRGVLGWNDLLLFRLQCSADRQGQLHNLHAALIVHQDISATTTGLVSQIALVGMRKLSQEVFAQFKRTYIDSRRNFIAEVANAPIEEFLGTGFSQKNGGGQPEHGEPTISERVAEARSAVGSFVIYQLSNSQLPNGLGVGCGHYDEAGTNDGGGIATQMNKYVFDHCFNPERDADNVLLFLDYCLSNLSRDYFSDGDDNSFVATKTGLTGGLDPKEIGRYWQQHGEQILRRDLQLIERSVFTSNYVASYRNDLSSVFTILNELVRESSNR